MKYTSETPADKRAKEERATEALMMAETTRLNLETAKLALKKMTEQLSMRTATVAQMAAVLISAEGWPEKWGAAAAVKVAEELMAEAEASAAKAKELQEIKDSK